MTGNDINSMLKTKYPHAKINVFDSRGDLKLDSIIIPKEKQGRGMGSQILNDIVSFADITNKRVILTPGQKDDKHGTTSRGRLVKFYKKFGFVENKGKDYSISESMFRTPKSKITKKKRS